MNDCYILFNYLMVMAPCNIHFIDSTALVDMNGMYDE